MKIVFFVCIFVFTKLFAANSTVFTDRQNSLNSVKKIIQEEEMIARAYEKYVINEKKLPTNLSALLSPLYLNVSSFTSLLGGAPLSLSSDKASMTSRLVNTVLDADVNLKALYEGNLYRKRTYLTDEGTIGIRLKDSFARHLYYLMRNSSITGILPCITLLTKYCTEDNHIYIYDSILHTNLLMYYHIDKFKTGPIVVTNNTSLHITNDEFNAIPKGVLLYDTDGIKYTKTINSIEKLR